MLIFIYLIYILLVILGVKIFYTKNNFEIVIYSSLFSLCVTLQYILLNAFDVAITESAVGVCLNTVLSLKTLSFYKKQYILDEPKQSSYQKQYLKEIISFCILAILCLSTFYFFSYKDNSIIKLGDDNQIIDNDNVKYYIEYTKNNLQVKNIVTVILGYFRGYDTLIELLVILTAGLAANFVLPIINSPNLNEIATEPKSQNNIIYNITLLLVPLIILSAFYLQINGEESPGGGFQAGSILTCAFILYALSLNEKILIYYLNFKNLLRIAACGALLYLMAGFWPILKNIFLNPTKENLFLNYDFLICSENSDNLCYFKSQKIGIFLIELGVGITVFAITLALFLNLKSVTNKNAFH